MENEKIIARIKKLFELSKNNPSQEEAQSAALKAQELLAQYHISAQDVEDVCLDKDEPIGEEHVDVPARKWKYHLANIVAQNFRCKHFYYGKDTLVFYGHETDAKVASETFKYLFKQGNRLANKEAREARARCWWGADGVYNTFVLGFVHGLKEAFAEQSTALMVVVPEDVNEKYKERTANMRSFHTSGLRTGGSRDTYERGRNAGHEAMARKRLGA